MALTVKQLNGDASFLLTFEPIRDTFGVFGGQQEPFRVLLDPWITETPQVFHTKISSTVDLPRTDISSLRDLPVPDLVIISQNKNDYCNEATLRQLPASSTRMLILAEPAAAKTIKSWNYFDRDMIQPLRRWEDPRQTGKDSVTRIAVPRTAYAPGYGELTVSLIPQKRDFKGTHSAIGITYRPPPPRPLRYSRPSLTPPATPTFPIASIAPLLPAPEFLRDDVPVLCPPPAIFGELTPPATPSLRSIRSTRSTASLSRHALDRSLSVIFSPHGTFYESLEAYATSHLLHEAALPLTALLHCFDTASQPWWRAGAANAGAVVGQETAAKLGARAWINAHDGDKSFKGIMSRITRRKRYAQHEVHERVKEAEEKAAMKSGRHGPGKLGGKRTEVMSLVSGEEVALTSEGIWETTELDNLVKTTILKEKPSAPHVESLPIWKEHCSGLAIRTY